MSPRKRTASHQVSAALLNAAETVLDRHGTAGVTVRAVAQEAAVSPMSVYNRFEHKEGLVVALAMRALEGLADAIDVAGELEPPNGSARHAATTGTSRYAIRRATR